MHRDAVVGGLLALLSVGLLWKTRDIPHPPFLPLGPAFYPRVVLVVFLALSLALVVSGLRAARRRPAPRPPGAWRAWLARHRLILGGFLLFGGYTFLMPILGFLLSTALFVAAMQWLLGRRGLRRVPGVLAVAAGTAVATYLVFEVYLYVLLPRGVWLP